MVGPAPHTMPIEVANIGPFRRLRLPDGWIEAREKARNGPRNAMRVYHPLEREDVTLCLSLRRTPLTAEALRKYRQVLASPYDVLFDIAQEPSRTTFDTMENLKDIIGTAADNQVLNTHTDWRKSVFELQQARVIEVESRKGLHLWGRYRNPETDETSQWFNGLFFDFRTKDLETMIFEIFMETKDPRAFEQYAPALVQLVQGSTWQPY